MMLKWRAVRMRLPKTWIHPCEKWKGGKRATQNVHDVTVARCANSCAPGKGPQWRHPLCSASACPRTATSLVRNRFFVRDRTGRKQKNKWVCGNLRGTGYFVRGPKKKDWFTTQHTRRNGKGTRPMLWSVSIWQLSFTWKARPELERGHLKSKTRAGAHLTGNWAKCERDGRTHGKISRGKTARGKTARDKIALSKKRATKQRGHNDNFCDPLRLLGWCFFFNELITLRWLHYNRLIKSVLGYHVVSLCSIQGAYAPHTYSELRRSHNFSLTVKVRRKQCHIYKKRSSWLPTDGQKYSDLKTCRRRRR